MKLISLEFKDVQKGGWDIGPIPFKNVNLLVGASGSGKTRTLNSLFNIASLITNNAIILSPIQCKLVFGDEKVEYTWSLKSSYIKDMSGIFVETEELVRKDLDANTFITVLSRDNTKSLYQGNLLPKLDPKASLLFLLREEEIVQPVITFFSRFIRRNFFDDALKLGMAFQNIPKQLEEDFVKHKDVIRLLGQSTSINGILFLLHKFDRKKFDIIERIFKEVFENITTCGVSIVTANDAKIRNLPVNESFISFWIKENNVIDKIYSQDMSSGMQKVLMILTDIISLPDDIVYLVDEYENSLGVNAIDFLPSLLLEYGLNKQIVITTHHPYLINKIPINDWLLVTRIGSKVSAIKGEELAKKYGNSRQESFMQLINDPLYTMENR